MPDWWNHAERVAAGVLRRIRDRRPGSEDPHPWEHPFLTADNLSRFRRYSEAVWEFARSRPTREDPPLSAAFVGNMAQSMYKWACMTQQLGVVSSVLPLVQDRSAINQPQWEEFDGEWPDPLDGDGFLAAHGDLPLRVPALAVPTDSTDVAMRWRAFWKGDRRPLFELVEAAPELRHEALHDFPDFAPYVGMAREVARHDVAYAASLPVPAYLSGRPYCVFSVGGDLQIDAGRSDHAGALIALSFAAARFVLASNPHTLGHARRLGLANVVLLPYPMDDSRYSPGPARARADWEAKVGPGVFVLSTARLDPEAKGQSADLLKALVRVARERPQLRFVFLQWGLGAARFRESLAGLGDVRDRFLLLPPVGKSRLIDYYRSCDLVLDSFVYGYYGATALEAASVGRPVLMKLRREHYAPLYLGDVAPVSACETPDDVGRALLALCDSPERREAEGRAMREWLVRQHGEATTASRLVDLLRLARDREPLPEGLDNPLRDPLGADELRYAAACQQG